MFDDVDGCFVKLVEVIVWRWKLAVQLAVYSDNHPSFWIGPDKLPTPAAMSQTVLVRDHGLVVMTFNIG